jgi:hypothetical protein
LGLCTNSCILDSLLHTEDLGQTIRKIFVSCCPKFYVLSPLFADCSGGLTAIRGVLRENSVTIPKKTSRNGPRWQPICPRVRHVCLLPVILIFTHHPQIRSSPTDWLVAPITTFNPATGSAPASSITLSTPFVRPQRATCCGFSLAWTNVPGESGYYFSPCIDKFSLRFSVLIRAAASAVRPPGNAELCLETIETSLNR